MPGSRYCSGAWYRMRILHGRPSMMLARRQVLQFVAAAPLLALQSERASAQAYPTRPVRVIVTTGPGGQGDTTARLVAAKLTRKSRPVVLHREHARRRRQHRHGRHRARGAGRLYDPRRHQQHRHQHQPLSENLLRSLQGLRADFADVLVAACAGGASFDSGAERQRTGRAGEGEPRQIQLRLGRPRHARASGRRIVQAGVRRRHHARAVQRRRPGHRVHARRPCADRGVGACRRR